MTTTSRIIRTLTAPELALWWKAHGMFPRGADPIERERAESILRNGEPVTAQSQRQGTRELRRMMEQNQWRLKAPAQRRAKANGVKAA